MCKVQRDSFEKQENEMLELCKIINKTCDGNFTLDTNIRNLEKTFEVEIQIMPNKIDDGNGVDAHRGYRHIHFQVKQLDLFPTKKIKKKYSAEYKKLEKELNALTKQIRELSDLIRQIRNDLHDIPTLERKAKAKLTKAKVKGNKKAQQFLDSLGMIETKSVKKILK